MQQQDDPTRFVLVEAYRTQDAPAAHKETRHYQQWRDAVAPSNGWDARASVTRPHKTCVHRTVTVIEHAGYVVNGVEVPAWTEIRVEPFRGRPPRVR